jgi:hypothetical protein
MSEHETTIRRFTDRYAAALSEGDLETIVDCWGVPAIVISDQGVQPVAAAEEVGAFFGAAIEQYRSSGMSAARPRIAHIEQLGDDVHSVDVEWSNVDERGEEVARESWRYTLKGSAGDSPRIHAAVMKTNTPRG